MGHRGAADAGSASDRRPGCHFGLTDRPARHRARSRRADDGAADLRRGTAPRRARGRARATATVVHRLGTDKVGRINPRAAPLVAARSTSLPGTPTDLVAAERQRVGRRHRAATSTASPPRATSRSRTSRPRAADRRSRAGRDGTVWYVELRRRDRPLIPERATCAVPTIPRHRQPAGADTIAATSRPPRPATTSILAASTRAACG